MNAFLPNKYNNHSSIETLILSSPLPRDSESPNSYDSLFSVASSMESHEMTSHGELSDEEISCSEIERLMEMDMLKQNFKEEVDEKKMSKPVLK